MCILSCELVVPARRCRDPPRSAKIAPCRSVPVLHDLVAHPTPSKSRPADRLKTATASRARRARLVNCDFRIHKRTATQADAARITYGLATSHRTAKRDK